MANFENGWICQQCWGANREQDRRCYRCHTLSPMEERLLAMEAAQGPPPPGAAVRMRRGIAERLLTSRAQLLRMASGMAGAVRAGSDKARRAAAWVLAVSAGAGRTVLAWCRRAASQARRAAAGAGHASVWQLREGSAVLRRLAASLAMNAMRAVRAGQRYVALAQADVRRAAGNALRLVPARR